MATNKEKIFPSYTSDKEQVSRYIKNSQNFFLWKLASKKRGKFTEEDIQIENKLTEKYLTSLVIIEMRIKTAM